MESENQPCRQKHHSLPLCMAATHSAPLQLLFPVLSLPWGKIKLRKLPSPGNSWLLQLLRWWRAVFCPVLKCNRLLCSLGPCPAYFWRRSMPCKIKGRQTGYQENVFSHPTAKWEMWLSLFWCWPSEMTSERRKYGVFPTQRGGILLMLLHLIGCSAKSSQRHDKHLQKAYSNSKSETETNQKIRLWYTAFREEPLPEVLMCIWQPLSRGELWHSCSRW